MLLPDERGLYAKRFPRPDEVREACIVTIMEGITGILSPSGCDSICINNMYKDDVIRRLNYSGWEVKSVKPLTNAPLSPNHSYYSIAPKEIK